LEELQRSDIRELTDMLQSHVEDKIRRGGDSDLTRHDKLLVSTERAQAPSATVNAASSPTLLSACSPIAGRCYIGCPPRLLLNTAACRCCSASSPRTSARHASAPPSTAF
jgi:hypothetical protein